MKTKVKICGITSVKDAEAAVSAGADAIGLVFYQKSPRAVEKELAREIAMAVGAFTCVTGLFVNEAPEIVQQVLDAVPLNLLQFHGDESREQCTAYGRPWIKALRVQQPEQIDEQIQAYSDARGILLDSYVAGKPGGTGEVFNWSALPPLKQQVILAGGLDADNVASAMTQVKPYAVDVSGGVEQSPGIKDHQKINDFIQAVRACDTKGRTE
jgi:phosphoribosylanthranilate isomerase